MLLVFLKPAALGKASLAPLNAIAVLARASNDQSVHRIDFQIAEVKYLRHTHNPPNWEKYTEIGFSANGQKVPYLRLPGWPIITAGMEVAAVTELKGRLGHVVGWVNRSTGEIVGPDVNFALTVCLLNGAFFLLMALGIGSILDKDIPTAFAGVTFLVVLSFFPLYWYLKYRTYSRQHSKLLEIRESLFDSSSNVEETIGS